MEYVVVLITAPKAEAKEMAMTLVQEKLAACANIIDIVSSVYWWEGKIQNDEESLLILKTKQDMVDALIARTKQIHSYTVPEIIVLPIIKGNQDYLNWISESMVVLSQNNIQLSDVIA
ncbi:divalent-cation tolerance protein CutA [bacterium]|nr:divalent-cation tolerance protein CutA [bacterium]